MSLKVNRRTLRVAAVLIGASVASPVAASAVVTRSSGPVRATYPDGTRLDDNVTIVLTSDSQVTVVTTSGVRTLRGPGSFRIGDIDMPSASAQAPTMPTMDAPDVYDGAAPRASVERSMPPPDIDDKPAQQVAPEPSLVEPDGSTESAQKSTEGRDSPIPTAPQTPPKDGAIGSGAKAPPTDTPPH